MCYFVSKLERFKVDCAVENRGQILHLLISCDIRECLSRLNYEFSLGPNRLYTFDGRWSSCVVREIRLLYRVKKSTVRPIIYYYRLLRRSSSIKL